MNYYSIKRFLKNPEIQEYLNDNNLDSIYEKINTTFTDFDCGEFTDFLYGIDLNPLQYVTKVWDFMFYGLETMSCISIPGNCKSIEEDSFKHCYSLEDVILEPGVEIIKDSAFIDCNALESITIPNTVKQIDKYALPQNENFMILCNDGSYAQSYAISHNHKFKIV